jgi:hypothetical protein
MILPNIPHPWGHMTQTTIPPEQNRSTTLKRGTTPPSNANERIPRTDIKHLSSPRLMQSGDRLPWTRPTSAGSR